MSKCIKASATQKTVLLIQDDSEAVSFIKRSKIADGYALVTLSNGKEALERVGKGEDRRFGDPRSFAAGHVRVRGAENNKKPGPDAPCDLYVSLWE